MKKLLVLFLVAAMCVNSYGSILVYKTSKLATVFDLTAPGSMTKLIERGYLVLDVNLTTQTVTTAQQVAYSVKDKTQQTLVATVELYDDVAGYIVADYFCGYTEAVLSGKTADGKSVGLTGKRIAKSLKGSALVFDSDLIGSGTMSATLDTATTKANVSKDIATVVGIVTAKLAKYTVIPDANAPTPDPMTWATGGEPNAWGSNTTIRMTATTAFDTVTPPVKYKFTNVTASSHSSGWQDDTTYVDSGLAANHTYAYNVKARDSAGNVTAASTPDVNAITAATVDDVNPAPDPMTWATGGEPNAISDSEITMAATEATDAQGVEYKFTCANDANFNSPWLDEDTDEDNWTASTRTWISTGLAADTDYFYNVRARDKSASLNTTAPSADANDTTFEDTTVPDPNPATWATVPEANGSTAIYMVATTATDAHAVQYYFDCVYGSGHDSTWQVSPIYQDTGLAANTEYGYRVSIKDAAGNTTLPSSIKTATTDSTIQQRIAAVVAARTGTELVTVTITAGTYIESIEINDPCVKLVGAGAATTIIAPGASYQQAIDVNADYVTIDGFTVMQGTHAVGVANPKEHTIWVHADYSTIQNCTIIGAGGNQACILIGDRDADHPNAAAIWGYNVATGTTKGHTIQHNTFRYGTATNGSGEGWGIFAVKLTDDCLIHGNTFNGDANDMAAWNTNEGAPGTGIQIHSAEKGDGTYAVTIEDNTATYQKYSWLTFLASYPFNDADGVGYEQAEDSEVNDVLVTGNTIHDLGKDGIHTSGTAVTFKGQKKNAVSNSAPKTGDLTIGAGGVTITDNTFYNNDLGVLVDGPTSVVDALYGCVIDANNITITDNAIYSNVTAGLYNGTSEDNQDDPDSIVDAEYNWWGVASGPYQEATNPTGAGNAVLSDDKDDAVIDYEPYWINAAMTDPNTP